MNFLISLAAQGLVNSKYQALSILGLQGDPLEEDINKAFKEKAKMHHPDKPGGDAETMKMLIAARDFLLEYKDSNNKEHPINTPDIDNIPLYDLSYEDIADMRKEMGRDAFEKKYPGWTNELKHEMGLDAWNKTFEGYNPKSDIYHENEKYENMMDSLYESAYDCAYELFQLGMEEGKITLYSNALDLLQIYSDKLPIPSFIQESPNLLDLFNKRLIESFNEILLKNVDDLDVSYEDMLDYPNMNVIQSFLLRNNNVEDINIPDYLFANTDFMRAFFLLLDKDVTKGLLFADKYRNNPKFIEGILNSRSYLYYLKNNLAKNVIMNLPFNESDKNAIKRILKKN